jgi:hypothetical protein
MKGGYIMAEIEEALLTTDNFNKPKVVRGAEANCILIVRLILMEKGSRIGYPNMGIGIKSRYRYTTEDEIPNLETEIYEQISEYLPEAQGATIKCVLAKSASATVGSAQNLLIGISFGNYTYMYDVEKGYKIHDNTDTSNLTINDLKEEE